MSIKRQATTELNHTNWDQEDPEEQEEIGTFKTASKDVLEKRVIRTAKRRTQASSEEAKKSVFSGFGGFNKTQPSSFDFLANLTNGNKNENNDKSTNNDTPTSNTLFSSKPTMSSPTGIFGTTLSTGKGSLGSLSAQTTNNLFSTSNTAASSSVFTAVKADSTVKDSPFKIQPASKFGDTNGEVSKSLNSNSTVPPSSQVTSNIFGISSTSGTTTIPGKSLFATTNNTSSLFKTQTTNSAMVSNLNTTTKSNNTDKKLEDTNNDKKLTYYSKLKGLNESVSDWIKKHVEETPLCILTPIFKDYEKYLKEMQHEFDTSEKEDSTKILDHKGISQSLTPIPKNNINPSNSNTPFGTLVAKTDSPTAKTSIFGNPSSTSTFGEKPSGFSFGINSAGATPSTTGFTFGSNNNSSSVTTTISSGLTFGINASTSVTTTASTGFSIGNKVSSTNAAASSGFTLAGNTSTSVTTTAGTSLSFGSTSTSISTTTTSTPFTFSPNKSNNNTETAPFSFGTGKPFSFNSNITQKGEANNDAQEEEDAPPKVEFTPIAEENSVYDKRCKVFHKKDGNFVDKGVGTLYIKKIDDSDKHQLLVRANTALGNVLLNVRLSSAIPTQKMGKTSVVLVCIPTPESKPPPTPVAIRVKTAEEADELLETLNKYKS